MSELKPSILERINSDFKIAMKSGDKIKLETLRSLRAALKEKEISLRTQKKDLTEDDILSAVTTAAKKRREAIDEYRKANRNDRVEEEEKELKIIREYLPEQLSEREIEQKVQSAIRTAGAESMKDMGKVMSLLMHELKGRTDGKIVQNIVKKLLGG
jgi:uncharacterized protein